MKLLFAIVHDLLITNEAVLGRSKNRRLLTIFLVFGSVGLAAGIICKQILFP